MILNGEILDTCRTLALRTGEIAHYLKELSPAVHAAVGAQFDSVEGFYNYEAGNTADMMEALAGEALEAAGLI